MGDRFTLIRIDSSIGRRAPAERHRNTGDENTMRREFAAAVGGVIEHINSTQHQFSDAEDSQLVKAADIVTLARTGVERDFQGDIIDAHAPEMPTRFAKQLAQLMRGAVAIGMTPHARIRLAIRCARDSIPPLRHRLPAFHPKAHRVDGAVGDGSASIACSRRRASAASSRGSGSSTRRARSSASATWDDPADYAACVARSYRRDFWNQQPHRVLVMSEKGTVRGVLAPVLDQYAVGFLPVGGFSQLHQGPRPRRGRRRPAADPPLRRRLRSERAVHVGARPARAARQSTTATTSRCRRIALTREHLPG